MSALPELDEKEIERLAVKHEAFGFGRVDDRCYTTHGFDPEGLHGFVADLRALIRKQALEDAAKVCQKLELAIDGGGNHYYRPADARQCVNAIKELTK